MARRSRNHGRHTLAAAAACAVLLTLGCAQADLDAAQDAYRFGRIETAAARIDAYTRDHGR
ncbi:MAG: hypothetical protein AAF710_11660, partial [Planctomycetota bacterium]